MQQENTSDALQHPPSFDEMVGLIKKLFTDYLEDVMKTPPSEIDKAWERYKTLNHLYQDEAQHPAGCEWVKSALQWAKEAIDFTYDYVKVPESLVGTWGNMYMNTMNAIQEAQREIESPSKEGNKEREDWIDVNDRLPKESGRYWCYVKELTDLGWSYFQWNCAYNEKEKRFSDSTLTNGENVSHWRELPPPPQNRNNEKH